jgi:hypothetical protein
MKRMTGAATTLEEQSTADLDQRVAKDGTDAGLALSMLRQAANQALGHSRFVRVLQLSRRGGLAVIDRDGELMVFKLIGCQADRRKRLGRIVGWNPARRAFRMSRALERAGLPVCTVTEHGSVSLPGAPRAVWTISRYYQQGATLRARKRELQQSRASAEHPVIRELYTQGILMLRRLHDAGFEHRDCHAGNLLIGPPDAQGCALRMLDLDTVVKRRPGVRGRSRDLSRYIENFLEPGNYQAEIENALRVYADGSSALESALSKSRYVRRLLAHKGVLRRHVRNGRVSTPSK